MTGQEDSSRERIVEVAIHLFAERGFEGASIRDITSAAGCGVAAVNYHFGGKEHLYEEAFRALFSDVQERRMEAVKASMVEQPEMELEDFLHAFSAAFLEPLMDDSRGGLFMSLLAREMSDRRLPPEVFIEEFIKPFIAVSVEGLTRFGPPMTRPDQVLCLMSVIGQLIHMLRAIEMGDQGGAVLPVDKVDDYIDHIVRFSAAGIRACCTEKRASGRAV